MSVWLEAAVVLGALACPAHMLWRQRKRRPAAVVGGDGRLSELRAQRRALQERVRAAERSRSET